MTEVLSPAVSHQEACQIVTDGKNLSNSASPQENFRECWARDEFTYKHRDKLGSQTIVAAGDKVWVSWSTKSKEYTYSRGGALGSDIRRLNRF